MSAEPRQITSRLAPSELFAEFEHDGFTLRNPATDTAGLYRTRAVGCCLEPLIVAGDELLIDRNALPEHGDLVYFAWPAETVAQWRASARGEAWAERWGSHDMTRGLKLYWEFPHDVPDCVRRAHYLLTNEDATEVKDHELLGVVRAVVRGGVLISALVLAACGACEAPTPTDATVAVASIDPSAVGQFLSSYTAFVGAVDTNAASPASVSGASTTYVSTGAAVSIDISCNYYYQTFGAAGSPAYTVDIAIYRDGAAISSGGDFNTGDLPGNFASLPVPVAIIATDNPTAGSHTYTIHITVTGQTGANEIACYVHDAYLKIREYKSPGA
jgi:hypothetical protein